MTETTAGSHCVVIGLGNPQRGDDGLGREVIRRLQVLLTDKNLPAGAVELLEHNGEAADLLELFESTNAAMLVDACVSGQAAGHIRRFDVSAAPLPNSDWQMSTHGLGLAEAIELARALGQLPVHCLVYTVEAANVTTGTKLSPVVAAAIDSVCEQVIDNIADFLASPELIHA